MLLALICVCCSSCLAAGAEQQETAGNFKNDVAVQEVLGGKRTVANAAWWGFNKDDSTDALQGAINSGASKVIVPYMGSEWIVRPIKLASNQEIVFEPGVVVTAKKGEFKGKDDCLFSAYGKTNITLRGYGAIFQMLKKDYRGPDYRDSQWRHVLSIRSCTGITVSGLTLRNSGGDGIYVGVNWGSNQPCENVQIEDCLCDQNYRQGISLTSGENVRIKNCLLKNTSGHAPGAGIDLEPNSARDRLVNVVISECVSENNNGPGFVVSLRHLSSESEDVSILFVNCYVRSGKKAGIALGPRADEGPKGLIEFRDCTVENTGSAGFYITNKSFNSLRLRFTNCKLKNVATRGTYPEIPTAVPICLFLVDGYPREFSGIEFNNCYVYDNKNRPSLAVTDSKISFSFSDVGGNINVYNPYGGKVDLGGEMQPADLKIKILEQ